MAYQLARVNARDYRYSVTGEEVIGGFLRAPIAGDRRKVAHSQTLDEGPHRLAIAAVSAVVPDLRIRENHDLTGVGRIREDFLVSGDRGVEDDLARPFPRRTKCEALEDRSVLQGEDRFLQIRSPPVLIPPGWREG